MSTPDERAFRADLERAPFLLGVAEGRWELLSMESTVALIAISAKDGLRYTFRFDITGYPLSPPTARLWNPLTHTALEGSKWPRSRSQGRLGAVFRQDWKNGTALYLPCDRGAIEGHDNWRTQMPSKIWRSAEGIVQYLEQVHELLHCADYDAPHVA